MSQPLRGAALVTDGGGQGQDPADPLLVEAAIGLVDADDVEATLHPSTPHGKPGISACFLR